MAAKNSCESFKSTRREVANYLIDRDMDFDNEQKIIEMMHYLFDKVIKAAKEYDASTAVKIASKTCFPKLLMAIGVESEKELAQ